MALFVDLGDDDSEPPQDFQHGKPVWRAEPDAGPPALAPSSAPAAAERPVSARGHEREADAPVPTTGTSGWNSITKALGCYPIIVTIASSLDLNSLDNLSRTCRQVRAGMLQYRAILVKSSLRCVNEALPVDPEQTFRHRARAGNWYYMEDTSRTSYEGKPGSCAQDMVSECRRCGTVVCRNCAIKPPAPIVLRDRHRRLCKACTKAPIAELVKPPLQPSTPLDSEIMQSKVCRCELDGVWLCQPCGRSIRSADHEYKGIWRWRNQYGEVLGGVGIGIGDGDRGVPCAREDKCRGAKECEHETDCEAADAAAADNEYFFAQQQQQAAVQSPTHVSLAAWALLGGGGGGSSSSNSAASNSGGVGSPSSPLGTSRRHTPSPGYARHEIEGIGGVVKTKLVRMVKVGAGVPEFEDEKARGKILGREVAGRIRSWCGWCDRVVPGQKDIERDRLQQQQQQQLKDGAFPVDQDGRHQGQLEQDATSVTSGSSVASPTFASSCAVRLREK